MKLIELIRLGESNDSTFGFLKDGEKTLCVTLEDKWRNNEHNISCIPVGEYICKRWDSPRFKNTYKVMDVPERSDILIHWGNRDEDTQGCILVGEKLGMIMGEVGIIHSLITHRKLMEYFNNEDFKLIVSNV
jgi:hypothetical protein